MSLDKEKNTLETNAQQAAKRVKGLVVKKEVSPKKLLKRLILEIHLKGIAKMLLKSLYIRKPVFG